MQFFLFFVSDENLNRAYRILNTLICTIDDLEGCTRVMIEQEKDKGYFSIMRAVFFFEMREEKQKKRISSKHEGLPPNLSLSMIGEGWMERCKQYTLTYQDEENRPLENQIGDILLEMFRIANKAQIDDMLKNREWKRKVEEAERQRRLEQMRKGELEEIKMLDQAAKDWSKAQRIRQFADQMEIKINEVFDPEKRDKLLNWLAWARDKADWIDPFTEEDDDLLGKGKHIFEVILESE